MDKFFSFGGMPEYFEEVAKRSDKLEDKEAAQVLSQPADLYLPSLMQYYTCDPAWPICLYDFTHRNLNPKFNSLKVEQPLTSFVKADYFSLKRLQ